MEGKFPEGQHITKGDWTIVPDDTGTCLGPDHSPLTGALWGVEKAQGLGSGDIAFSLSAATYSWDLGTVSGLGLVVGGVPGYC